MSALWKVAKTGAMTTNATHALQNYGENPNLYTARASYMDIEFYDRNRKKKLMTRGVVMNIDREDTVARACFGKRCGTMLRTSGKTILFFHIVNLVGMTTSILSLNGMIPIYFSVLISLVWMCGPIHLFLNANRKVLRRQLRYSGHPYFQLYLSGLQTYAIMDLFQFDPTKLMLIVPPLFIGLISLTISDAVYILEEERACAIIDVLMATLWQIILALGVRFNLFQGMIARGLFTTFEGGRSDDVLFQNSSLFSGKSASIIVMLVSQIIFRMRHPEQAFSLRGHYSIMSNAEWAKKEARIRVSRRETLESSVRETSEMLLHGDHSTSSGVSKRSSPMRRTSSIEIQI